MPRLFVVMPFGTKSIGGDPYDFDAVYGLLIRPAATEAGWEVSRIDESPAVGAISQHYLREVLFADLVLAEISAPNANVFYELGLRHAVSASGTVLIAKSGTAIPFDLADQRVIFYTLDPQGVSDGVSAIRRSLEHERQTPSSNSVRTFLEASALVASPATDLPAFERDLSARIDRARSAEQLIALWQWIRNQNPLPLSSLFALAERLTDVEEWAVAADVLRVAARTRPEDFEVHRQLAWYLRHLGREYEDEAIAEFERALSINPNDPEALGMIGGLFKRRGDYPTAEGYYARAAEIAPRSLYARVGHAGLAVLANPESPDEGLARYSELLTELGGSSPAADEWAELVLGEAAFALGDFDAASAHYTVARSLSSSPKSLESAASQLDLFAAAGFRPAEAQRLAALLRAEDESHDDPVLRSPSTTSASSEDLPVIVHISDMHFTGVGSPDVHRFDSDPSGMSLTDHLLAELRTRCAFQDGRPTPVHLVVSGDLTWRGTDAEFDRALQCLIEVAEELTIPRRQVHIAPGNHDVNWHLAVDDQSRRFDNYLRFLGKFYGDELLQEKYPAITWPITIGDMRPVPGEIVGMSYDSESHLFVASLNSCVYENEEHHYGYIGERQLKLLRDQVTQMEVPTNSVRVAVMHHHLHPFPEYLSIHASKELWTDLSTVRDAGIVERMLEKLGFDLVLHGHKHRAQTRETLVLDPGPQKGVPRRLVVCGAGSVSCSELEHAEPNQYQVIELQQVPRRAAVDFARVTWRTLQIAPGAEWVTAQTWDIAG